MIFSVIMNYGYVDTHVSYFRAKNKKSAARMLRRDKMNAYLPSLKRVGFKRLPRGVREAMEQ